MDAIAREAARRLARGESTDIAHAARYAAASLDGGASRPPTGKRIRRHAQAMSMQAMGEVAYRGQIRAWLAVAEDLMTTLEQAVPASETILAGRAAEGHFDGDPGLHIRMRTERSIAEIARAIAAFGYEASEATFPALESLHGRLSQMHWVEDGLRIVITRCPRERWFASRTDLKTGKVVVTLTLPQLRARLTAMAGT
jgi:hypothetical protein